MEKAGEPEGEEPKSDEPKEKPSVKQAFDEIAGEWAEYRSAPTPILAHFISLMPQGAVALDAGCGNARNSVEIAAKAGSVFAVDFSKKMLERAAGLVKEKGLEDKIRLVEGDVRELPLKDASVDSAFYVAVLHHLETAEDRRAAFAEMSRVLKPGGKAFVAVWNGRQKRFSKIQGPDAYITWKKKDGTAVERFHHFFEAKELGELAEAAGLAVERVFYEKGGVKVGPTKAREAQNVCAILAKRAA